jgi:hypothetical protein
MTIEEQIAVLQALKEGKKIEAKRINGLSGEDWHGWEGDADFVHYNYRIAAEPRRWLIYNYNGKTLAAPYDNCLVSGATLICSAVEEPMPTQQHVDAFIQNVNKILTTPEPECSGSLLHRSK